ncbi:MAG: chemotaxis protein CheW, partial [Planctomycetota bacterium]
DQLLTLLRLHDLLGLPAPPPAPDAMQFVVVVAAGDQQFGLVVDGIQDTEEIVVKPLSHHLSGIAHYAGATIRGDGSVCLILDMAGIMRSARIAHEARHELHEQELQRPSEQQDFLVFTAGHDERFALPLQLVNRIEQHPRERVRRVNGTLVLCRDDQMLPLIRLEDHCTAASDSQSNDDSVHVIILQARGGMGLLARAVIDSMVIDVAHVLNDAGILGNRIIAGLSMVQGDPVSLIDAYALMDAAYPESRAPTTRESQAPLRARILYCEDAQFFQNVVGTYLREAGHSVTVVDDGRQGWEQLQQHAGDFDLLITDLEMPELNGWQLIQEVRTMPDLHSLPIIALTSLSDEQARQQSLQVGADEHVVKLQKDELHETVMRLLRSRQAVSS